MKLAPTTRTWLALALVSVLHCSSASPPAESVHQTFEQADVGRYTGGWPGADAGAESVAPAEVSDEAIEPEEAVQTAAISCPESGQVCGVVESTSSYCGGAQPPPQLLEQLATPQPYPGYRLLARRGQDNIADAPVFAETVTDDQGRFLFDLEPGWWCFVGENKRTPPANLDASWGSADPTCLEDWFRTCESSLLLTDHPAQGLIIQIHQDCRENPCLPPIPYP
jgi:hypothetical protein